ncbi:MAG: hypothetical protein WDO13_06230 [Verrucomicrobiota bacterium]
MGVIPVMLMKDRHPWIILVPIAIGLFLIVFVQLTVDIWPSMTKLFFGSFSGPASGIPDHLADFQNTTTFSLQVDPRKDSSDQELFPFFDSALRATRKPQKVRLESGKEMYILGAERFVELLVDQLLKDSDKVVENSMTMAAIRFGKDKIPKVMMEAIQADFRGNWIATVSRDGEVVLKKVGAALYAQEIAPKLDAATRNTSKKK